jgi:hypothetical protein
MQKRAVEVARKHQIGLRSTCPQFSNIDGGEDLARAAQEQVLMESNRHRLEMMRSASCLT